MNQRRKAINHCMTTPYIWSTKGFNTDPLDQQTGVLPTKLSQSTTVIQGFKQTGVLSTKLSQSTTVIQGIKQKGVLQQSCLNQQQSFRVSNRQVFYQQSCLNQQQSFRVSNILLKECKQSIEHDKHRFVVKQELLECLKINK